MPDDWAPTSDDWKAATDKFGAEGSVFELRKFRDHCRQLPGSKGLSADWNARWRMWMDRGQEHLNRQKPVSAAAAAPVDKTLFWEQACTTFKKFNRWHIDAGPDPDSPACKCPPEILQKHGLGSRAA